MLYCLELAVSKLYARVRAWGNQEPSGGLQFMSYSVIVHILEAVSCIPETVHGYYRMSSAAPVDAVHCALTSKIKYKLYPKN